MKKRVGISVLALLLVATSAGADNCVEIGKGADQCKEVVRQATKRENQPFEVYVTEEKETCTPHWYGTEYEVFLFKKCMIEKGYRPAGKEKE